MKLKKILKKFYFEKVLGYRPTTVVLRHKISEDKENYLQNHGYFLKLKNIKTLVRENLAKEIFLEIGFGSGEHLVSLGLENIGNEKIKILGIELYTPGATKVLQKVDTEKLENIFVSTNDARDVLKNISNKTLSKIFILFPDPWTKKRQFGRRLVNLSFLKKCLNKLKNDGEMVFATDWENYAEEIEKLLQELNSKKEINFEKITGKALLNFESICNTNFAKRAKVEGREITIFVIKKNSSATLLRFSPNLVHKLVSLARQA